MHLDYTILNLVKVRVFNVRAVVKVSKNQSIKQTNKKERKKKEKKKPNNNTYAHEGNKLRP